MEAKQDSTTTSFRLSKGMKARIERYVNDGNAMSPSDFIRSAMEQKLTREGY